MREKAKIKEYYSTREAAQLLGVAVSTIQLWTNNGLLKAWVTGGGHRRIARHSVEDILKNQRQQTDAKDFESSSIVIVEDSAQQMRLYKKHFSMAKLHAQIITAPDGYEGLIQIGRVLPEVIITDLKMPNMDGFRMIEAFSALEELEHSLIIVVSGLSEHEIEDHGGLPSGVRYFQKPVNFEVLVRLIQTRIHASAA